MSGGSCYNFLILAKKWERYPALQLHSLLLLSFNPSQFLSFSSQSNLYSFKSCASLPRVEADQFMSTRPVPHRMRVSWVGWTSHGCRLGFKQWIPHVDPTWIDPTQPFCHPSFGVCCVLGMICYGDSIRSWSKSSECTCQTIEFFPIWSEKRG